MERRGAHATPITGDQRQRFLGLHWKAFLWLSALLWAMSAAFYGLS